MSQLIETIKVVNGRFQNLSYHSKRLNNARNVLFGSRSEINIEANVPIPNEAKNGLYRCTITYDEQITNVSFQLYSKRIIKTLKIIIDNTIDYSYKYADRNRLNELMKQKEECDEIIIVKNNMVTDTSYTNIILYDGAKWVTPDSPLLAGTKRGKLLQEGLISETKIEMDNIFKYQKIGLINAMLEIGDITIDTANIKK